MIQIRLRKKYDVFFLLVIDEDNIEIKYITRIFMRNGYDRNFLGDGISIDIPKPNLEIEDDVLKNDKFREEMIVDYIHYSVIMSISNRQALVSAANVDQKENKSVDGRRWFLDSRIGSENQVGNQAYLQNDWDRGHLTRRTSVTWGSNYEAKRASNDSCSYANASMQHKNFNQDEWRVPENEVHRFERDKNDKLCVFTGPIFTEIDRWYSRRSLKEMVRIPSGFWKMIAYIDKNSNKLACQAYVLYQDDKFLADRAGSKIIVLKKYQVTVTEIERITALEFDEKLYKANPLYFHPRPEKNIEGPEGFDVEKTGVIFSREDADNIRKEDKRELKPEEFEDFVAGMDI